MQLFPRKTPELKMPFHVYSGRCGWVIVPDFLQPPIAASRHYPLSRRGEVDDAFFHADELDELQAAIAQAFYAIAPKPVEDRLRRHFSAAEEAA